MLISYIADMPTEWVQPTAYREEADLECLRSSSARRESPSHVWYLLAELEQAGLLIEATVTSLRFVVVGAGRLGASLALALRDHGAELLGFTANTDPGRARAEAWLGGRACANLGELVHCGAELYVVAVPDQALAAVAEELAAALTRLNSAPTWPDPAGRHVVIHTSGATSIAVLAGCERAGAATLAFHPLQTFSDPATGRARFAGAAVALTPSDGRPDSPAGVMGFRLARALDSVPFLLTDDKRALYHAAATVACNYLVTLQHHARRLFVTAGLPEEQALSLFLPLVNATLDNIAHQGTLRALTGPLSRGDIDTVHGHLRALGDECPDLLPLYRELGLATLGMVQTLGEVPVDVVSTLAALLDDLPEPHRPGA